MDRVNPTEIIQWAVRIEENGRLFYQELARRFTQEKPVSDFFGDLAEQEGDHRNYFEGLARKVAHEPSAYPLSEEYFEYLRGFADPVLFTRDEVKQAVEEIGDLNQALDFCMQRELKAVDYYRGLSRMLPDTEHPVLDQIIAEEQRHYDQLSRQRERIASK